MGRDNQSSNIIGVGAMLAIAPMAVVPMTNLRAVHRTCRSRIVKAQFALALFERKPQQPYNTAGRYGKSGRWLS